MSFPLNTTATSLPLQGPGPNLSTGAASPSASAPLPYDASLTSFRTQATAINNPAPEDPAIGLKAMGYSALLGLPVMAGIEKLYDNLGGALPGGNGKRSLIERGLAQIDRLPGIRQLGEGIDWLGVQMSKTGKGQLPPLLKRFVDFATPSVDQFLQKKLPGDVLYDHVNDYLKLVNHLAPNDPSLLKDLKQTITADVEAYRRIANKIPAANYTSAPGHSIDETNKLLDKITTAIRTHLGWAEGGLSDTALVTDDTLKATRVQLLKTFGITEAQAQAAGLSAEKIKLLTEGKSLDAIRDGLKQGFFKRFSLSSAQKKAAKQLNKQLAQASKYQRRMLGIAERLTGMGQMFLPVYEADRVLSQSLKQNTTYNQKGVGAVTRFIGGLCNDLRDSLNGAVIGVKHTASGSVGWVEKWFGAKAGKAASKAGPWAMAMIVMVQMLKGPFEAAFKADDGDKAKTFAYKVLTEEIPMALTFIIGLKVLHEVSFIKLAGTALQKVGLGKLASMFFRKTWNFPILGRVTLGGFLLTAVLPSMLFGSRMEHRFTWLAKNSIGTPKSIKKAKADAKASEEAALKQKLPAAFFHQRPGSQPLQTPIAKPTANPFKTVSGNAAINNAPTGVPLKQTANPLQHLIQKEQTPLPLANGAVTPNATATAAAQKLQDTRTDSTTSKAPKPNGTPALVDDGKISPLLGLDPNSINDKAPDINAPIVAKGETVMQHANDMGITLESSH